MKPLEGIKVLELADFVSAPVCCRFLADMGATVIKVERPAGNTWRETGKVNRPDRFCDEENPVYDIYNTGKMHIVLDLKTDKGLSLFHRLLEKADVFVTNFRLPALVRLGLDHETVRTKYPALVYAIGLGYGEKGPNANDPAYDHTAFWAKTGFLLDLAPLNDDYYPIFPPSSMGDTFVGMTLAAEVCAAIYRKKMTGEGDYVKASLFHNGIFAMGTMQIKCQRPFGDVYPKTRAQHGLPHGSYKCSDGEYIYIAAGYAQALIPKVFSMIGRDELWNDSRFNSVSGRKVNCDLLYGILRDAFLSKPASDWLELAKQYDIPITRMQHFADVSDDEQALANGYIEEVAYPNGHVDKIVSSPIEMESVGCLKTEPTKAIGADTDHVLKALGLCDAEISQLQAEKII